ncbi:MAG: dTDP-4-dehydrorhamnose reductase, partial [Angustibacter sp.]
MVTGATGLLGREMSAAFGAAGWAVRGLGRAELDITEWSAVRASVAGAQLVVNCAAWTAVDDAEKAESSAFAVNAVGAANVARATAEEGARLIHISTDYVFAGTAQSPYAEDAEIAPRSAYGRTKAAGEWAVRAEHPDAQILRTAWLYGQHGSNFLRTMERLLGERDRVQVVADQLGQPTWAADVAALAVRILTAPAGIYHATAEGHTSWWGFAREIAHELGLSQDRVQKATSAAFARPAPRPAYSVLGHEALLAAGIAPIGHWVERLRASGLIQ